VYAHGDAFEARHAGCEGDCWTGCEDEELADHPGVACMRVEWERECVFGGCVFRSKVGSKGRGRVKECCSSQVVYVL
jgi:hypothetical protein